MPKIKEEIQLPSLEGVIKPKEGISLYNNNGKLKILHSNGTSEIVYTGTDGEGPGSGANIDDANVSTSTTYSSNKIDTTYAKKTDIENKQDKLTAGTGITITGNVISSTATGPSSSVTFRTWEA